MSNNRFNDALFIWAGACNPSGITHALLKACDEARRENADLRNDPAIQLITAQLAYIVNVWDGVSDLRPNFNVLVTACEARRSLI